MMSSLIKDFRQNRKAAPASGSGRLTPLFWLDNDPDPAYFFLIGKPPTNGKGKELVLKLVIGPSF